MVKVHFHDGWGAPKSSLTDSTSTTAMASRDIARVVGKAMASKSLHVISKKVTITPHGSAPVTGGAGTGEWAVWVNHDEVGIGDTSDTPSNGDIDLDNDGVFGTRHRACFGFVAWVRLHFR